MALEYCVMHRLYPDNPCRIPKPMWWDGENETRVTPLEWCELWIKQWNEDNKNGVFPDDLFYIAVRETTPWTRKFV